MMMMIWFNVFLESSLCLAWLFLPSAGYHKVSKLDNATMARALPITSCKHKYRPRASYMQSYGAAFRGRKSNRKKMRINSFCCWKSGECNGEELLAIYDASFVNQPTVNMLISLTQKQNTIHTIVVTLKRYSNLYTYCNCWSAYTLYMRWSKWIKY